MVDLFDYYDNEYRELNTRPLTQGPYNECMANVWLAKHFKDRMLSTHCRNNSQIS